MLRARIFLVTTLLLIVAAESGAQEGSSVSVRIAKTSRSISPFGEVMSDGGNAAVVIRLAKERDNGYETIARKREPVASDGSYRTRFDRPQRGQCRVVVVLVGSDSRDEEFFPCYTPDFPMGRATLTHLTPSVEIDALIAETDPHRQYGLMYRPKLRADLGMAFLYESQSDWGGFWMKNTLLPLSIAFFDSDGLILRIIHMEPCEQDPCPVYDPDVPYRGALEVNQGAFDEWGISEGDRIEVDPGS